MERDLKADPETEAALLDHLHRMDALYASGDSSSLDVERLLEIYAPDITTIGTGADETVFGISDLSAGMKRDFGEVEDTRNEWKWTSVYSHGRFAWLIGECEVFWRAGGRQNNMTMRITNVYEKRDERWLMVHQHCSVPDREQPVGRSYPTPIQAIVSSITEERPDLTRHASPDGTVTMLFTDVENSTVLTERLGDTQWLEVLREHNAIVREQVKAHACFEVKSQGDGFMVASQSARRAVHCAIGIQRDLARHNETAAEPIHVRMGLHTGEVLKDADDFFGKHVILASRIAGKARGGEILVSSLLKELTASGGDISFGPEREVELKGLSGTHLLHDVLWQTGR